MFLAIAKSYELCALKQMQSLLWSSVFSLEQWNKWPNIRAAVGDDIFKNTYLKSPQILFLNNVPQASGENILLSAPVSETKHLAVVTAFPEVS